MATLIREERYIFTDVTNNSNKFWNIKWFDDNTHQTEWGRIGDSPNISNFAAAKPSVFDTKCREKERKGYVKQSTIAGTAVVKPSNTALVTEARQAKYTPDVQKLLESLIQANIHQILEHTTLTYNQTTGLFSTPLGLVTEDALDKATSLLNQILQNPAARNDYLTLVPQRVPKKREVFAEFLTTSREIDEQRKIISNLRASLLTATPQTDATENKTNIFTFDIKRSTDISEVERYFYSGIKQQHMTKNFKVVDVYDIDQPKMTEAFKLGSKVGNIQSLWHGSSVANILSILVKGFYIPPSTASYVTGRLYGNGSYFANSSTKSLNYGAGYWSGQRVKSAYMFLCDVAVGKSYTPKGREYRAYPVAGYNSTWAKAGVSGVINDELIVYNTDQVCPRKLVYCEEK